MSKSKNAVRYSWRSNPNAPAQFHNEADRRLELANLTKESEDDCVFAYASINGGVKTATLKRDTVNRLMKEAEANEDKEENLAILYRHLVTSKYLEQLCEKKVTLQQKGLSNEEIKTALEKFCPDPELLAIVDPNRVDEFVRMAVEGAMKIDE
jgi:hypothetical protein